MSCRSQPSSTYGNKQTDTHIPHVGTWSRKTPETVTSSLPLSPSFPSPTPPPNIMTEKRRLGSQGRADQPYWKKIAVLLDLSHHGKTCRKKRGVCSKAKGLESQGWGELQRTFIFWVDPVPHPSLPYKLSYCGVPNIQVVRNILLLCGGRSPLSLAPSEGNSDIWEGSSSFHPDKSFDPGLPWWLRL